jgi:hypothetical protein
MPTTDLDDAPPGRDYKPQAGGLADRVCRYFTLPNNTDEDLTAGDIAIKFDAPRSSVQQCLAKAVLEELLVLARTDEGIVWRRGPRLAQVYAAPTGPSAHTPFPAAQVTGQTASRRGGARKRLPPLDAATIPVETLPLPPGATERREGQYDPLFARLQPGQCSAPIDARYRGAITKAAATWAKRHNAKFATRLVEGGQMRIWRTQ